MAVTPADIAVALGRTAPEPASTTHAQWAMWITDAEMLIESRRVKVDDTLVIDEAKIDYVVREAVVAQVRRPDDATQVTKAVDDGSVTKTYKSARGRVQIVDEWWALLGLIAPSSGAFSVRPGGDTSLSAHMPWCNLMFLGDTCSCGANLTGYRYPLWEGGVLDGGYY